MMTSDNERYQAVSSQKPKGVMTSGIKLASQYDDKRYQAKSALKAKA
jgi:hypothetical protein